MANNPYVNKVVYGDQTVIDLTMDDLVASDLRTGKRAHDRSGAPIQGTANIDGAIWGNITGDIDDQTDLQGELAKKVVTLTKAQYDVLSSTEKNDPKKVYYVTDYDPIPEELDDKCDNSVVGTVEKNATASRAYAIGEHFIRDGKFCTAKTSISSGSTLTLNTNYTAGTVGDDIDRESITVSIGSNTSSTNVELQNNKSYSVGRVHCIRVQVHIINAITTNVVLVTANLNHPMYGTAMLIDTNNGDRYYGLFVTANNGTGNIEIISRSNIPTGWYAVTYTWIE